MAMQMFSPSMMQDANQLLEETTVKFPDYAEAWSLYGQVGFLSLSINKHNPKIANDYLIVHRHVHLLTWQDKGIFLNYSKLVR